MKILGFTEITTLEEAVQVAYRCIPADMPNADRFKHGTRFRAMGIEIDEEWCRAAVDRLTQEIGFSQCVASAPRKVAG